ncbi:hypothetical protein HF313_16425 [Massilia atriviolacea]|uniref:Uncharacterized protein n=1 Tax=Massilia atriviolacea TaxID=2495579 RepID=A0A430HUR4_9BURK|nr:hypothetical protein [Massilia atriviolacea]RSZ61104.1 hypothetical protein EJB06_02965 [Massilia atriviolacea]
MSRISSAGGAGRAELHGGDAHFGIAGPSALDTIVPVKRTDLTAWEESASLSPFDAARQETLAPLTRFLGAALTVANPAWSRDPLPGLRALQKRLVDHSLALDPAARADSMEAILVVEDAVRLRLRFQQMELARFGAEAAA